MLRQDENANDWSARHRLLLLVQRGTIRVSQQVPEIEPFLPIHGLFESATSLLLFEEVHAGSPGGSKLEPKEKSPL